MADLIDDQRCIASRLSRIMVNLKKRGKANINLEILQENLEGAKGLWSEYNQSDRNVRAAARKDAKLLESRYFKEEEYNVTQDNYFELAASLRRWIKQLEASQDSNPSNETVADATAKRSRAVLPKMSLPAFEGHYKDWPSFRDLFTSLIINEPTLSSVERLHYLKACMKGSAASILKNVQTTADNFQVAWEKLESRFGNRRLLVQAQIRALSSLAPVRKESAAEMKRLYDETFDAIDALENLGRPVTNATDWIVEMTVERLDRQTRREWEDSLQHSKDLPTLDQLKKFMEGRIHTCEALEPAQADAPEDSKKSSAKAFRVHVVSKDSPPPAGSCGLCQGSHYVLYCDQFKEKTPVERREVVRNLNLCYNCLGKHSAHECKSRKRCQKCLGKHNTTLHVPSTAGKEPASPGAVVQHVAKPMSRPSGVLLGTARVSVSGPRGEDCYARSLIDPGSEVSLMSEALAQRLGVKRIPARVPLLGVGGAKAKLTRGKTTLTISPHYGRENEIQVTVYIIPELSRYTPRNLPAVAEWDHVKGLRLADPGYHLADPVDILLGADSYNHILREGVKRGQENTPIAQETALGWILTGGIDSKVGDDAACGPEIPVHHCNVDRELMELLTRFWEQEEIQASIPGTEDDRRAEEHFAETHLRQPDGRFVVRLPFSSAPVLGDSRRTALRTLESLNGRFSRSAEFQRAYSEFLDTYEALGHMTASRRPSSEGYYLPHHGVLREASSTTKLRVVFNGSMPSSNGKSINDFLLRGPNLLLNIADVLLRWRLHEFVFSADIEKMYRQIVVHPDDRKWQRILWKTSQESEVTVFELNTVTYGLSCAPYLAIRCLHQLAKGEEKRYPSGASVILRDVYMDDVLSGADTLTDARRKQQETRRLLMAGGFPLRKWASNSKELLDDLSPEELKGSVEWNSPTQQSVLGIRWLPSPDCFQVTAATSLKNSGSTKRAVLSGTAQLFDPLGWLAPVIIVAKVVIQSLWLLKVDWDTPLPEKEHSTWQRFRQQLPALQTIRVPRWLGSSTSSVPLEIHGFADASERAYAGVVYSRSIRAEGGATVSLIVAKSKVAPLKKVSLPRLELTAAFLLARLVEQVIKALDWQDVRIHLWSDSSVALSWIRGHPSRWPTYVANRVAEIQRMLPQAQWHQVKGTENPADCASRGLSPAELPTFELWWRGPEWLSSSNPVPEPFIEEETHEAEDLGIHHVTRQAEESSCPLIKRFSNLNRLLRVLAWCLRWIPRKRKGESFITATEVHEVKLTLLRLEQAAGFSEELSLLRKNQSVKVSCRLAKLCPFLDQDGVLRVGGRLQAANTTYEHKHPAILPDESPLARLWVDAAHNRCLHGGTQLTLATLRQECWILRGRPMVKQCIRQCTVCIRWRGETARPKMGNLPVARITQSRPFLRSGIDYAGPIELRVGRGRGRGQLASKGYIAVFVCLATKAVHLEVVSDGTTETFIAALKRFTSRRGKCLELHSDCGRNFVGADKELRTLLREATKQGGGPFEAASREGITWKFNPPAAPHFGGVWEAAVKSVKHHLRRIIGEQRLSFEELTTLLAGIEACLNSRPMQPLHDDSEDPVALTPGHFLVGEPLTAIPEPSLEELPMSRLSRWQLLQQMQQHFWRRWSQEYLNTLQTRVKWRKDKVLIEPGFLCLVKNEILPPTQWALARVVQVHLGPDGAARVATIRTATSQFLRPVHKLIPLLKPEDEARNTGEDPETGLLSDSPDQ